ncbi:zinc metalloprotease domain protein, partial [Vibrio parahaemolyticus V-223/04]
LQSVHQQLTPIASTCLILVRQLAARFL